MTVRFHSSRSLHLVPQSLRNLTVAVVCVALTASAACRKNDEASGAGGAAPGGGRAMMALPVDMLTLEQKPVEQVTEYVGTIKSRHSTTIQPQAEGFITKINVKAGDRVKPGAVLFEIDSASLQVAIAGLESVLAAREADAAYARQQAQRMKSMYDIGAGSQQEMEQAQTTQKTAEAQLKAVQEQIRQQRTELAYYQVKAPVAGVVGDIPNRQGDRVTRQTQLTTIDDNSGLELYVNVPVNQATGLKVGLPVRLLNDAGDIVATEKITFVAPSVDDTTQTVLAKATIADRSHVFRPDQFMRARIVWASPPGLLIPVVATMRINGQYFVFVAENGPQGGLVAKQRQVVLGAIVGNDYVVQSGLKAGEKIVTGGIQKLMDGAPVQQMPSRGRQ